MPTPECPESGICEYADRCTADFCVALYILQNPPRVAGHPLREDEEQDRELRRLEKKRLQDKDDSSSTKGRRN